MFSRTALGASALLALFSTATAHLAMLSPQPILDNVGVKDPLDASGSNFPCHGATLGGSYGSATEMVVGKQQTLSWDTGNGENWAVHGGGSCQLSVTYETDPTKIKDPANWKVIYSMIGGCPTNSLMNLDGTDQSTGTFAGPNGGYKLAWPCSNSSTNGVDCVNTFAYAMPKGMKDGDATLAWTWFNNVGNREMYMNCAAIKISGGDGSEVDSLPSMFVANLASVNNCPSPAYNNLVFPNPGQYATSKAASFNGPYSTTYKAYPYATPAGDGCADDGGSGAGGSYAGAASTPAATPVASTPSTPPAASTLAYSIPANTGAGFGEGAASASPAASTPALAASSPTPAASSPAPVASSPAPIVSTPAGTAPVAGSTGGACANPCSEDGKVVCIGSSQFGLCNRGCAFAQDLAAGTTCKSGVISKRDAHVRRVPPQARHAHRRIHGADFF